LSGRGEEIFILRPLSYLLLLYRDTSLKFTETTFVGLFLQIVGLYCSRIFLPRYAMHKRGLCRHAVCVCVCLCVRHVRELRQNDIFKIFPQPGSQATLVFPYQTECRYSDGNPTNEGVECKGV